ncbi:hypothetical protein JCM30760_21110 [Thiomicrorhabdus hydrogeniphila]
MSSMTCFKVVFPEAFPQLASREAGENARRFLKQKIDEHDCLVFDLANKNLTPSFVDSSLAVLMTEIGYDVFKRKVKFDNTSDTTKILIKRTFSERMKAS